MSEKQYFGVMLDCSRNAVMKVEEIKKYMTTLKSFGYNMLMLYTEDTYEVDGEPFFGYLRGRYTKEELRDLDRYLASIDVELIPCIQTLAHLNCPMKWPVYADCIKDANDILLVDDDRTYEFIDRMLRTVSETYLTKNVHIGMDEAHMLGLGKYLDIHGYENRFDILTRHLKKVVKIAEKYGLKPLMWSDMFYRLVNHGKYYNKDCRIPEEVRNNTPKNVDLVYWDYYHTDESMYDGMIAGHKEFGNDIWFAGGAWSWRGFAPMNRKTLDTMAPAMRSTRKNGIDKIFITLWGDNGKECSFHSLLPSLYATRKFYEGVEDMAEIKRGFKELTGESFDDMMLLDCPNEVAGNDDQNANTCKTMLYSDLFLGFYDSAVKPGAQEAYREHAKALREAASRSPHYGYLFEEEAKLCEILEVKYALGVELRAAYKAKDTEKLRTLTVDIQTVMDKSEELYGLFKEIWFRDNKPHGFDVQDLRFGALNKRLQSCKERVEDYISGKISEIPELEETILNYYGKQETASDTPILCLSWEQNVTPNRI